MHCFLLFYRNDYMKIFIDWFIADLQYCVSFRSTAKIFSYIYIHIYVCVCVVKVTQLCLTLCDPVDYSQSGSSVHGIFQARILEWVGVPFSGGSSQPRSRTQVSHIAGRFSTAWITREAHIYRYISIFFFWSFLIMVYCKILNIGPCATDLCCLPISYIVVCIC